MKERIKAVQRVLWGLFATALALCALAAPQMRNSDYIAAAQELRLFKTGFDQAALEQQLLQHARKQGLMGVDEVARQIQGPGIPAVKAKAGAVAVLPSASLSLNSLGAVEKMAQPGSTITIGRADPQAVAAAIGWRLSRKQLDGPLTLEELSLQPGAVTSAEVAREADVVAARTASLQSQADWAAKNKAHEGAEKLYDMRRKWHAPWKSINRANEKRLEAKQALDAQTRTRDAAVAKYEKLAQDAEKFGPQQGESSPERAVVVAKLSGPGAASVSLRLPVKVHPRAVQIPPITGVAFPHTHAAGIWQDVAEQDAQAAIAHAEAQLGWHYRHTQVGPLKLGGMTLLQLGPLTLLALLGLFIRRMQGVGSSYDPFHAREAHHLPRVGWGTGVTNLVPLMLAPLSACALCTVSLIAIDELPVIPLLCALGCVAFGGWAFTERKELRSFRDAITRSHSTPPPAPAVELELE